MTFQNFLKIHQKLRWAWVIRLTIISVGVYSCVDPIKRERTAIAQTEDGKQAMQELPSDTKQLSGEVLAKAYCQACHQFPSPDLLDKHTWVNSVLPNMGERLGIKKPSVSDIFGETDPAESKKDQKAIISNVDWQKIVDYYQSGAPETLAAQSRTAAITVGLTQFEAKKVSVNAYPLTTLLKYNSSNHHIYLGTRDSKLFRLKGKTLKITDSLNTDSPPSDIAFYGNNRLDLLKMGIMDPNDQSKGLLVSYHSPKLRSATSLLTGLIRPVQMDRGDLNADKREDLVICQFGNNIGKLSWYENTGRSYKEHILKSLPGARRALITDLDSDGLNDVVCLMTQGQEGIYAFYNLGNGTFKETPLLKFPPVYGSSDFELVDFNKDGALDILYTNGDNADLSPILKPYHGVRLFINNKKNQFKQHWFYPQHGSFKALARDFDEDGDLDIASISFFPDLEKQPEESFIYFENFGAFQFKAISFEKKPSGRWLTMEASDIDQDGDEDILLGAINLIVGAAASAPQDHASTGPALLVLKNKLISK